jgi:hypothetical protein
MQTQPPPAPHSWTDVLYLVVASLITALIVKGKDWYKIFGERFERRAQKQKTQAEGRKIDAETDQLHITSNREYGDEIVESAKLLARAELKIGRLELRVEKLESVVEINEKQISDLECVITFSGINKGEVLDKIKGIKPEGK